MNWSHLPELQEQHLLRLIAEQFAKHYRPLKLASQWAVQPWAPSNRLVCISEGDKDAQSAMFFWDTSGFLFPFGIVPAEIAFKLAREIAPMLEHSQILDGRANPDPDCQMEGCDET